MGRDEELLQGCLAGAPGAWEAFVSRFTPLLAGLCGRAMRRCGLPAGPAEVEDMVQGVFAGLLEDDLKALRSYQGRASVAAYLGSVAVHRVLKEKAVPPGQSLGALVSPIPGPPEAAEAGELLEKVRAEAGRLPARERLALSLQSRGASLREIGQALGISRLAAGQLLSRAREEIRRKLRQQGRPEPP